jgi:hypothetical protein
MDSNFAIPGLMMPDSPKHLARGIECRAGGLLNLGVWETLSVLPHLDIWPAVNAELPWGVIPSASIADCRGQVRTLAVWLPADLPDGDWFVELTVGNVASRRVLFRTGRTGMWEVAPGRPAVAATVVGAVEEDDTDVIWQGVEWARRLYVRDVAGQLLDLTGWQVWGQLRNRPGGTLLATMVTELADVPGAIDISMTSDITNELPGGFAWWDVLMQAPDDSYERVEPVQVLVKTGVTQNA